MKIKITKLLYLMGKVGVYCYLFHVVFLSAAFASNADAQRVLSVKKAKVSVYFDNTKLSQVFKDIESKTNYNFIFDKKNINLSQRINLSIQEGTVADVLLGIARQGNIKFRQVNNRISAKAYSPGSVHRDEIITEIKEVDISGQVTDENGEGLPGASIVEKGTTNGTISDSDGNYRLRLPEEATLVISYVGYKTQEILLSGRSVIDIQMVLDVEQLSEIVVIGYGAKVAKSDLTGAVSSANLDRALETSNVSIVQALRGTIAGLNVGAVDAAGQNPSLSVRGQNTLSGSQAANEPLIILDGIIYRGSLIDLNTADIESIEVLKDVSSASIYGSQASNGVILITTKNGTGSTSKPIINYTASYSIQTPTNSMRPMQADEYREFFPDIFWEQGSRIGPDFLEPDPNFEIAPRLKTQFLADGFRNGIDTPWWDLLTRDGSTNTHNLSIRGQTDNTNYFVSGGYTGQKGFLVNDDYKRYNFRVNLDTKLNDWLTIGTQTFVTVSDYSGRNAPAIQVFRLQPWAPVRDDQGEILPEPVDDLNPLLTSQIDDSDIRLNLFNTLYADIQLPVEGLSYRMNYSNSYRTIDQNTFNPWGNNFTGEGRKHHSFNWDWTLDNIVSYNRIFNDVHDVGFTFVYGLEKRDIGSTTASATNFGVDILGYNSLSIGDIPRVGSSREQEQSLYQMVRLLYGYKNKYYFTGTLRRDGFSGFGVNNKTAVFPSMALGWTISEESFASQLPWLNNLKLRASYGQIGRRGVSRYQTVARVNSSPAVVFGDGNIGSQGQGPASLANPSLGWETNTGFNLGLDFGILNSRIRGNLEYYSTRTEDILFNIALPQITGFNSVASNIAEVSNHGVELTLSATVIDKGPWSWETSFVFNRVRNQIESILGPANDSNEDGREDDLVGNRLFIGEPQGVIFNYEIIGMWQLADRDDGSIWEGFLPGTYKLRDLNGDNAISSLEDRKILGYTDPSYRFGIDNTVTFKNFSLNVFINSIQGGENFYMGDDGLHSLADQHSFENLPSGGYDYWTPENPDARFRRLDTPSSFGAQYTFSTEGAKPYNQRSFVRLQDVTLAYTLPTELISKINLTQAKVFVSGRNLVTWTDWEGWDPETGAGFGAGGVPTMKSYSLGLNVSF